MKESKGLLMAIRMETKMYQDKRNLKYFKTELHPLPRTDGMKSLTAKKMADTICFENNTFIKTIEEKEFLIF